MNWELVARVVVGLALAAWLAAPALRRLFGGLAGAIVVRDRAAMYRELFETATGSSGGQTLELDLGAEAQLVTGLAVRCRAAGRQEAVAKCEELFRELMKPTAKPPATSSSSPPTGARL